VKRILLVGGEHYRDTERLNGWLTALHQKHPALRIVSSVDAGAWHIVQGWMLAAQNTRRGLVESGALPEDYPTPSACVHVAVERWKQQKKRAAGIMGHPYDGALRLPGGVLSAHLYRACRERGVPVWEPLAAQCWIRSQGNAVLVGDMNEVHLRTARQQVEDWRQGRRARGEWWSDTAIEALFRGE